MSNKRNHDHPPSPRWDGCEHIWVAPTGPMSESEVVCAKCGCPGDQEESGDVYLPAA